MARHVDTKRAEYWLPSLHRDVVRLMTDAQELDWRDPDGGPRLALSTGPDKSVNGDLIRMRSTAEQVRNHAAHLAHTLGVLPGEVPTEQLEAILEFLATRMAEEGEMLAADLLRDPEVRRDALIEFSGEEPRGAGADPYGRPDPRTNPEAWTE